MRSVVLEKLSVICAATFSVSTATAGSGALALGGAAIALAVPALWSSFSAWKDCPQKKAVRKAAKAAEKAFADYMKSGEIDPDAREPAQAALETVVDLIALAPETIRQERWKMGQIPQALLDAVAEKSDEFSDLNPDPQVIANRKLFLFVSEATIKALSALDNFEKSVMPAFRADVVAQLDRIEALLKLLHEQYETRFQGMGISLREAQDAVIRSEANLEQAQAFLEMVLGHKIAPDQFGLAFMQATARWFANNPHLDRPQRSNLAPEVDDLRKQAQEAWDANQIDHFYDIRKQISIANERALKRLAEQKREIEELEAARRDILINDLQEEANAAAAALNAEGVSDAIIRKIKLETSNSTQYFEPLRAIQDQWYERGKNKGLNFDLEVSIVLARETHRIAADANQKGLALNNLGTALQTLGERESNTERLEQAITAYKAALEEWTRDRVPFQWAATQNNLGNALFTLGGRDSDTERLKKAVIALKAALEERTRDRAPFAWAATQNNLGNALSTLGQRESGTKRLEQAVKAYEAALKEWTQDRVPLEWAMTQNNLGNALQTLGERESGTERLEEAVKAYKAALEERTRDRVPLDWAATQNNLGNALSTLGERECGTERLEESVTAHKAALEERTRDRVPFDWAMTMENLAFVFEAFHEKIKERSWLDRAISHAEAALDIYREARADYYVDTCEGLLIRLRDVEEDLLETNIQHKPQSYPRPSR